jgi:hypothetical protein
MPGRIQSATPAFQDFGTAFNKLRIPGAEELLPGKLRETFRIRNFGSFQTFTTSQKVLKVAKMGWLRKKAAGKARES